MSSLSTITYATPSSVFYSSKPLLPLKEASLYHGLNSIFLYSTHLLTHTIALSFDYLTMHPNLGCSSAPSLLSLSIPCTEGEFKVDMCLLIGVIWTAGRFILVRESREG